VKAQPDCVDGGRFIKPFRVFSFLFTLTQGVSLRETPRAMEYNAFGVKNIKR